MVKKATEATPNQLLRAARKERNWTQQEVADAIGSPQSFNISRWEQGTAFPSTHYIQQLCALFDKSAKELGLLLEEPTEKSEQELDLASTPTSSSPLLAETISNETLLDPAIPLQPAIRLVGRDVELNLLKQRLLTSGNIALTTLNGLPGIGKTALAIELVHDQEIQTHFSDGILWAALGPEPHLPGLLSRWGAMLGISLTEMANVSDSGEAWAIALRRAIGTRSMLLVIDDAWKLEDALTLKVGGAQLRAPRNHPLSEHRHRDSC